MQQSHQTDLSAKWSARRIQIKTLLTLQNHEEYLKIRLRNTEHPSRRMGTDQKSTGNYSKREATGCYGDMESDIGNSPRRSIVQQNKNSLISLSIAPTVTITEEPHDENVSHIHQCTYKFAKVPSFMQILSTPTARITSPCTQEELKHNKNQSTNEPCNANALGVMSGRVSSHMHSLSMPDSPTTSPCTRDGFTSSTSRCTTPSLLAAPTSDTAMAITIAERNGKRKKKPKGNTRFLMRISDSRRIQRSGGARISTC